MFGFIKVFFDFFMKLPKSTQDDIIDTVVLTYKTVFEHFFKKKEKKESEDLKQATSEATTPATWQTTTAAVSNIIPTIYPQKKRNEFAGEVIQLVKSDLFIEVLDKRIANIDTQNEEEFVYLCSIETRKLIVEMMDKAK